MFSLCVALGAVIGPLVGGYLSEHVSFQTVYIFCVVIGIISVIFSFQIPKVTQKLIGSPTKLVDSLKLFENSFIP